MDLDPFYKKYLDANGIPVLSSDAPDDRALVLYMRALDSGILRDTYRAENSQEYWAEGVQDYYDTNAQASFPDGVHNSVNTRAELATFDPPLHALIEEVMPATLDWDNCRAQR